MPKKKSLASKPAPKHLPHHGSGNLVFVAKDVKERYHSFSTKKIFQPYVINMEVLKEFGIHDEVEALLQAPEWKFLLVDFREEIHADLLLEVMATLQVPANFDNNSTACIHFAVGKTAFHYSLDSLSEAMGFDGIQGLSDLAKSRRLVDIPDAQGFWKELTDGTKEFKSSQSPSTQFTKREHKFLQYILARSICGRKESSGKVTHTDLLCLYGIVKKRSVHLGHVLGCLFQNQYPEKVDSIFLGPYVTRLVKNSSRVPIVEPAFGRVTIITSNILKKVFPSGQSKKKEKRPRIEEIGHDDESDSEGANVEVERDTSAGSSRGEWEHQALLQLTALQTSFGQLKTSIGNIETSVGNLQTSVSEVRAEIRESREESRAHYEQARAYYEQSRAYYEQSRAHYEWLRSQYPPPCGPHPPYDPSFLG